MSMMNETQVKEKIEEYAAFINKSLERYLPKSEGPHKNVIDAMRYSIFAGGKRIRPALILEFCRISGGNIHSAVSFACAIEMIHTYSLIHDDLPCMDNDNMRRGKPSCHIQFGEATAMLAGDALLSLAFETALCDNDCKNIRAENILRAGKLLAEASGVQGMVGGQIIDLESEGKNVSLETLHFMYDKKTGAMIKAAAQIGCILADADEVRIEAAGEFAKRIGLAFQIVDDILDVTGNEKTLGKPLGSDESNEKSTYITHLGLEKSKKLVQKLTGEAIMSLKPFGSDCGFLEGLAVYLASREK